jgi:hypothetical protein
VPLALEHAQAVDERPARAHRQHVRPALGPALGARIGVAVMPECHSLMDAGRERQGCIRVLHSREGSIGCH